MISIPLVQIDAQTPLGPSQLARILNQIQLNIISGIKSLQTTINNSGTVIGQEITAYLTEAQFQQQMGNGWVLADGRNISGSAFAKLFASNTLPDRRGTVSRMKDNGRGLDPAGDLALGVYEADEFASHAHTITDPGHHHLITKNGNSGSTNTGLTIAGQTILYNSNDDGNPIHTSTDATGITTTDADGSAETRVKAIIANVFVRIN